MLSLSQRESIMVPRRGVVFLLWLASIAAPAAQEGSGVQVTAARVVDAPCPFTADERLLAQVRCGYLTVPENRSVPGGRQLRLAVAVVKSTGATPRPDPVALLSGGPGIGLVESVPRLASGIFAGLREDRDLIFWDQRGTGYSEPSFCPELTARWNRISQLGLERQGRIEQQRQAVSECREAMRARGVDFSQYNSVVSAHDLDDLRRALGVARWNLLGVSYGTRLALEAMRVAPHGIRSAVLDSPLPPNPPIDKAGAFADVVRRLARACAGQADCNAAFPDVEQTLWTAMKELEDKPFVRVSPDGAAAPVIDGNRLALGVEAATRSRQLLSLMPMLVHEARRRNETALAPLAKRLAAAAAGERTSRGLNLTIRCYESQAPLGPLHQQAVPAVLDLMTDARLDPSVCDSLHPFRARPELGAAVVSDVPTLIFTGEFDAITHRSFGPAAAHSLSRSRVVEIPGAGHAGVMSLDCTRSMVRAFIDDPQRTVDARCLSDVPPLRFVTEAKTVGQ